jgi:hypothetical protein
MTAVTLTAAVAGRKRCKAWQASQFIPLICDRRQRTIHPRPTPSVPKTLRGSLHTNLCRLVLGNEMAARLYVKTQQQQLEA